MVANNLAEGIAFQIAATRDARGLTQAQLAAEAGIANNFPRLEDPDYGKQTITTLKKIAAALDVALVVRFVPFSQYIDWLSGTPFVDDGLRPEALSVPSFDNEEKARSFDTTVRIWKTSSFTGISAKAASKSIGLSVVPPQPVTITPHVAIGTNSEVA